MATFNRYTKSIVADESTAANQKVVEHGSTDIYIGINICNKSTTNTATVDVELWGGTNNTAALLIAKGVKIPVGGSVEIIQGKIVAENNDDLLVKPVDAAVDVFASILKNA